ncbi:DUF4912 domain-containing protein [Alicyclobacillus pomorum]|uniref:DUF4912 domain-containing protein n=1 Tax=Alicyclobacillus pomorum TaxID=204470 RepID=UPI000687EE68|nr:DUF4912 domain-containing protein [Alicyclobacillus pomorum]
MNTATRFDEQWVRSTGKSRIVGMAKDPRTLFAYWEVDPLRKAMISRHFCSRWEELPLYLCVYDVTHCWFDGYNAPMTARCRVHPEADNWYFHDLQPHRNYVVVLATTTIHDRLFSVLRSNVVTLPPAKTDAFQPHIKFVPMELPLQTSQRHPYESEFDGYHMVEREEDNVCPMDI